MIVVTHQTLSSEVVLFMVALDCTDLGEALPRCLADFRQAARSGIERRFRLGQEALVRPESEIVTVRNALELLTRSARKGGWVS